MFRLSVERPALDFEAISVRWVSSGADRLLQGQSCPGEVQDLLAVSSLAILARPFFEDPTLAALIDPGTGFEHTPLGAPWGRSLETAGDFGAWRRDIESFHARFRTEFRLSDRRCRLSAPPRCITYCRASSGTSGI